MTPPRRIRRSFVAVGASAVAVGWSARATNRYRSRAARGSGARNGGPLPTDDPLCAVGDSGWCVLRKDAQNPVVVGSWSASAVPVTRGEIDLTPRSDENVAQAPELTLEEGLPFDHFTAIGREGQPE